MRPWRFLLWPLFTVFFALALGCGEGENLPEGKGITKEAVLSPRTVRVTRVIRRDFQRTFVATGSLMPKDSAELRALVEGPLEAVLVEIGDRVKAGKELFRIRPIDYQLAVESAEAALLSAQAALNELRSWKRPEEVESLKAELQRARAEYERLESQRKRIEALFRRKTVSESEWDAARTAAEAAKATVHRAEEQLRIAQRGPTQEQIAVAKAQVAQARSALSQARQKLRDTVVVAPYDGVITGKYVKSGDYAKKGQAVLEITDLKILEAEMALPEPFAPFVEVGLAVDLAIDYLSVQRQATTVAVNPKIDQKTRTFLVKVAVDNSEEKMKAGTFCRGIFHLPTVENALAVPKEAILKDEGRAFCWIANNRKAHRSFLRIGVEGDDFVHVLEGLQEGQLVIIEGAGALAEGDPLDVVGNAQSQTRPDRT